MFDFFKEFRVYICADASIKFPDKCVFCGENCKKENVEITGNHNYEIWFFNRLKTYFTPEPKIFVPIHKKCNKILNSKEAIRNKICISIVLLSMGITYLVVKKFDLFWFAIAALIPVLIVDYSLNMYWYPKPFKFFRNQHRFEFVFGNEDYAKEFKVLNKSSLYKEGIPF